MAAMSRLLPMMALSTFAVFLLALIATPANALSNTEPHVHARGHDSIAKRKRNALKRAKRCRPKSSSLPVISSTTGVAVSNTPAPTTSKASSHPTTTKAPATTTATTSKAVTTSVTPPSTGGGGSQKLVVLPWPNGPYGIEDWKGSNIKGIYTWSPADANSKAIGVPFYPMLWGEKQKSQFSNINGSKYDYCMFLNEPNQVGQSDMSVDDAVDLYWSTMEPARKQGCKVVSPATTSAPSGLAWMKEFFQKCQGCKIDIVALHWYDVSSDAFKAYVTNFYKTLGKPIWITEFACQNFNNGPQCTPDQTWALHQTMARFARDTPWIEGISPFGAMRDMQGVNPDNQLMNPSTGKPNALGQYWINGKW